MKIWILNTCTLSRLFIVEQVREPLTLFWSMIAPPLLFVFLNIDSLGADTVSAEWYGTQVAWYLSYLALSVSLFGFSMYLVGRRESGFMKAFIQGTKARVLFLSSQIIASLMLSFFYFFVFIFITTTAFGVSSIGALTSLALPFAAIIFVFIWSALFVSVIPITFMTANAGISIAFMTMLIFSVAGLKSSMPTLTYLNRFNPLSIATQFMSGSGVYAPESLGAILLMIALGGVGAFRMKINPIWSRQ